MNKVEKYGWDRLRGIILIAVVAPGSFLVILFKKPVAHVMVKRKAVHNHT